MSERHDSDAVTEEVDAVLVEAQEEVVVTRTAFPLAPARGVVPAVQAAAVAAGGFVAGAAVVGLVNHRRQSRALAEGTGQRRRFLSRGRGRGGSARVEALQIVSTRSLLVDVHLLDNGSQG